MRCTFLDENGKAQPMVMGCYGIGVTRLLGAAIEQGHDDRGIVWPISMAPFEVVICPVGYDKSESVKAEADALHDALLAAGIDVVLDNRGERPGAMFADWELIGVPYRVVIGERGLKDSQVEFQVRTEAAAQNIPLANIKDHVIAAVQAAKKRVA
jgi:prolyl-tRNA synthetase